MRELVAFGLECECASCRIDAAAEFLAISDELVAKALSVSEVAQVARAEMRMRQNLTNKWRVRADQAAVMAGAVISRGGSISTALSAVDGVMKKWSVDVERGFTSEVGRIYKLARIAGHKKGNNQTTASLSYQVPNFEAQIEGGKEKVRKAKRVAAVRPTFDLVDERAIADLYDDQMIWIGRHYDKNIRRSIRDAVRPELIEGRTQVEAGKAVKAALAEQLRKVVVPGGFNGSDTKYFEGLAANTTTNARVRGQIRSFAELGLTTYEIVNPMDDRTTPQCVWMNGKKFQVADAQAHIETLSGATDPEFVKEHHPWLSMTEIKRISEGSGHRSAVDSSKLANAGLPLPPYHFRCRTTVDVA